MKAAKSITFIQMDNDRRACLAYLVGLVMKQERLGSFLYDHTDLKYRYFRSFEHIANRYVKVFDERRACFMEGYLPLLFDYGSSSFININITQKSFFAFDNATNYHLFGCCSHNIIQILDSQTKKRYYYTLSIL